MRRYSGTARRFRLGTFLALVSFDSVLERIAASIRALEDESDDIRRGRSARCVPRYMGFDEATGTARYRTSCRERWSRGPWDQTVRFIDPDWGDIRAIYEEDADLEFPEFWRKHLAELASNVDIIVDCNCGDWRWFGLRYMGNVLGYATPGPGSAIPPRVRNPVEAGALCKHLVRISRLWR